tara:strand:- start:224 stop:517 length:294 start_codon:yes stop_codon:yes gene_type:complete
MPRSLALIGVRVGSGWGPEPAPPASFASVPPLVPPLELPPPELDPPELLLLDPPPLVLLPELLLDPLLPVLPSPEPVLAPLSLPAPTRSAIDVSTCA